jgi:hypothetical protein
MSENNNPWKSISVPSDGTIKARLIDVDNRWPFFWAVDSRQRFAFALEHNQNFAPKLPKFSNLEISNEAIEDGSNYLLVTLNSVDSSDIFFDFCIDLVQSSEEMSTEKDAFHNVLQNLGRWHRLLRGERSSLSKNQIQGLFGEIFVLLQLLENIPNIDIDCWRGPLGAAKDFQFDDFAIEVKTTSSNHELEVEISSEYQLDLLDCSTLFLYCLSLRSGVSIGENLSTLVEKVLDHLESRLDLKSVFLHRLQAAGLAKMNEYDDLVFEVTGQNIFEVSNSFPRLDSTNIPGVVSQVRYQLNLQNCSTWARPFSDIVSRVR